MSLWELHNVLDLVLEALRAVPADAPPHELGRPYVTSYQLAIAIETAHPGFAALLEKPLGGLGVNRRDSVAQYLGQQLSRNIRREGARYPIEGAFISDQSVDELVYRDHEGQRLVSSVSGTGYDLALFRLRQ